MDSDFIGSTLNIFIVVERIFRNLTARELNTCSRVCTLWRDQAKREKERRKYLKWNIFVYDHASSVGSDIRSWWQSVTNFLLESPIQPKCLLIFCSHSLWTMLTEAELQRKETKEAKISAAELFGPYLPNDCVFNVNLTNGIVGTDANMQTLEIDREENGKALSLIMFGETSGVEFVPFTLTHEDCDLLDLYQPDDDHSIPECMQPLLNKKIKMINMYLPKNDKDLEFDFCIFHLFEWPLVAGGYVIEQHVRDSHGNCFSSAIDESCVVSGMAICGANVKVAYVMIESQRKDIAEVERTVQALTKYRFPLHRSFGLMYSCDRRGSREYRKHNVESSIFRQYFPTTPLLGFFGKEEDESFPPPVLVGDEEETGKQWEGYKMKDPPTFVLSFATIICLVSLP
ncbi:hypothetical protein BsWGS_04648 [Bradybaena similaris]